MLLIGLVLVLVGLTAGAASLWALGVAISLVGAVAVLATAREARAPVRRRHLHVVREP